MTKHILETAYGEIGYTVHYDGSVWAEGEPITINRIAHKLGLTVRPYDYRDGYRVEHCTLTRTGGLGYDDATQNARHKVYSEIAPAIWQQVQSRPELLTEAWAEHWAGRASRLRAEAETLKARVVKLEQQATAIETPAHASGQPCGHPAEEYNESSRRRECATCGMPAEQYRSR